MRRIVVLLGLFAGVLVARTLLTRPAESAPGSVINVIDVGLPEVNAQGPAGPPRGLEVVPDDQTALAPGDTLAYTITWGPAPRADGYAITVVAVPTTGWTNLPAGVIQTGTTYLLKAINAAQPDVNFTVTVCSRKSGTTYTNKCAQTSWSVSRQPGPPQPPIIDSSATIVGMTNWEMLPDTVTLWRNYTAQEWSTWDAQSVAAGATQAYRDSIHAYYTGMAQTTFCQVGLFSDNSRYPLGALDATTLAYCETVMKKKYPTATASTNAKNKAATICPQYSTTGGGSITNMTCPATAGAMNVSS